MDATLNAIVPSSDVLKVQIAPILISAANSPCLSQSLEANGEWKSFKAVSGRKYWRHTGTNETCWKKPAAAYKDGTQQQQAQQQQQAAAVSVVPQESAAVAAVDMVRL